MSFRIKYTRQTEDLVYRKDRLEKTGDLCTAGLRLSCGKSIQITFQKNSISNIQRQEKDYALKQKIAAIFLSLLTLPISLPMTLIGILAYSISKSRKNMHHLLLQQQKLEKEAAKEKEIPFFDDNIKTNEIRPNQDYLTIDRFHRPLETSKRIDLNKKRNSRTQDRPANKNKDNSSRGEIDETDFQQTKIKIEEYLPRAKKRPPQVIRKSEVKASSCLIASGKIVADLKDEEWPEWLRSLDFDHFDVSNVDMHSFLRKYGDYVITINGIESRIKDVEINKIEDSTKEQIKKMVVNSTKKYKKNHSKTL